MSNSTTIASFPSAALAHLAVANLKAVGIEARVEGENHGGIGLDAAMVRVVVHDGDAHRARALLGLSEAPASSAAAASDRSTRAAFPAAQVAAVILAVVVAVLGSKLWQAREQLTRAFAESPYGEPRRAERCDVYAWKGTSISAYASCDLDGDGTPETSRQYSPTGKLTHESRVPSGKGYGTDVTAFDGKGTRVARSIDENADGIFETTHTFDRAGEESGRAYDDDADGRVDRWVYKDVGGATLTWRESTGDGSADSMVRTDQSGRVLQRLVETRDGWTPGPAE